MNTNRTNVTKAEVIPDLKITAIGLVNITLAIFTFFLSWCLGVLVVNTLARFFK